MKKLIVVFAVLATAVTMTSGCAVNRATATIDPTADLGAVKSMYVKKLDADGRGVNVPAVDPFRSLASLVTGRSNRLQRTSAGRRRPRRRAIIGKQSQAAQKPVA